MNKVFKVIWSEARNAYVVVSEIAKNHGSKSCSTKKLLTMLIATGVMTCASMAPAMAGNPAPDDLNVTIGKGAHVSVWNSVSGQTISGDIAVGPNAHAGMVNTTYRNKYARIGSKEYLLDFGQGGVVGAESIFGVPYKYKVADGSKIAGSIAIGKNTVARTGSVMLGDHSYTGKLGDIEINPANAMTYNDGIYSTTLGAGAYNSGSLAAVTGALSIASGSDTKNTGATIYGSMNSIESATSSSDYSGVALGAGSVANRANAVSVGSAGANRQIINVAAGEVSSASTDAINGSQLHQTNQNVVQNQADIAQNKSDITQNKDDIAKNKADITQNKADIKNLDNRVTNVEEVAKKHTTVTKGDNIVVSEDTNADGGKEYKVALNNDITLAGDTDFVSISGSKGTIWASGSVAAGNVVMDGATATVSGLGNTTTAYDGFANGKGKAATEEQLKEVATEAGKHTTLVAGDNVQVKEEKTDNGLKYTVSATDTTYTAGNGIAINGENNAISVKLKAGEGNLVVDKDGLALNKDLQDIASISNGSVKLALDSATETAGLINGKGASVFLMNDSTVINGAVGIDKNGKISGVANGVADKDAVNVSQLKDVKAEAGKHTTLSDGKNTTVESTVKDGQTDYKVNVAGDLTDITSVVNGGAKLALNGAAGYAGIVNGKGASVYLQDGYTKINNQVIIDQDGKISGVAAGTADTDAVNLGQLKDVKAEAGKHTTLSDGKNTTVESTVKDGQTDYKVNVAGDLTDITSVANGGAKLALNGAAGYAGIINGKGASVYLQDGYTKINNKVIIDQDGKISGVAAGTADTDAVNVSQLKKVSDTANAGWTLSTNGNATAGTNVKPGAFVDFSGDSNVSVSNEGTAVSVKLNNALKDIESISNGDAKLALNGAAGYAGIINGKGASVYLQDGYTKINNKVIIDQDGKISGVAAGKISADSTDAVNGSQLNAVATEAGKHSKVVNGTNTNVEESTVDGQKVYKVNLNNNVMVGDVNGKYVSISGTNGTVEATGAIATKDRVYADKGGKLADIDVTGNTISNGDAKLALNGAAGTAGIINGQGASVYMQGSTTVINSKVSVDKDGKISGVAAGTADTDAVNVSQLKKVSDTANAGWNLSTNGAATEATNVKPGDNVDFSGDKNISVSNDGTKVKVELNKNLKDIESISNGDAKLTLGAMGGMVSEFANGQGASVKLFGDITTINGKVNVYKDGRIAGVADGVNANDAVNVSQLKKVSDTANAGWNLSTNGAATEATNVKPGDNVDFSGDKNVSVSNDGTAVSVKLNKNLKDIETISNGGATLTLGAMGGMVAELANGQGASVKLFGDTTTINGKVNVYKDGRIAGVADGVNATDAVNVSQLQKAAAASATTVSDGVNTTVTATKAKDGHVDYKVNLNKNLTGVESISNGGASLTMNGFATELANGQGASVKLFGDTTTINGKVNVYKDGRIAGVADGVNANDAVNVSQLQKAAAASATTVSDGVNTTVTATKAEDGHTDYKVNLNKDLVGIESISNGDAKLTLGGFATELANGQGASVKLFGDTTTINNAVTVYKDGRISGVADGINNNDAVNVGQLNKVSEIANKGWNLATNGVATEATNVKPGDYVDFSGDKNISISHDGTKVKVELNKDIDVNSVQTNALNSKYNLSVGTMAENGIMPFFVNSTGAFYAASNKFSVDKDGKVTATAGEIGNVVLQNGVYYGHSTLQDGSLLLTDDNGNHSYIDAKSAKLGKVTVTEDGKITGVAAGAVTADSTDAVNGSQLHAVATEAGKHSKVVNGSNINVEEFDNDGQKIYKVNLNKDIMLGDLTGKYVSISGTNGTIETIGYIATKDRVYADKGGKLADIDVTGDKISNGASSIVLDGSNVKVNDKVTIDQNGKISGVAAGEISSTSTDAINGSQLHQTNENVAANRADIDKNKADIAALDNRVTQNEADIAANRADIDKNKADIAANRTDIDKNAADIAQNKTDIKNLNTRVDNVEELAKKHTTVTAGDNMVVTETTNKDGGKEYNVALDKDINLDSVTTGQTVMNNDGLKVGKDVSVTATAVTAGKTSISDEGVKVGDKTYISADGLNANDQKVTNVADGDISATSKDAVNGSQLYKTNQEVANNTNRINKLGSRVNKVGAGAAALAALHPMDFDPDDKLTFSAGYGNYAGENAAAIGAYYRPDEKVMFSVAGTVGNGENMVNAGVSFALDRTNHVSNSRTALAREVIDLRGQLAVMGAKMAKMEKAFGMLDETKTKLFPDVPANHWAYEYIAKLAGNGYIEGYPDGNFGGDRLMTRYEFAAMLYRAIENGAALEEKIIKEFEPELGRIRVDRISGEDGDRDKIERVRVNDTKGERDHYGNKLAK